MKFLNTKFPLLFLVLFSLVNTTFAKEEKEGSDYDPVPVIMEHIKDSHEWHITTIDDEHVSIPLPVILVDGGLHVFMSSDFEHGHKVVEKGGNYYALVGGKIYETDKHGTIEYEFTEELTGKTRKGKTSVEHAHGHVPENVTITNDRPLDLSITKNVVALIISAFLIFFIFRAVANAYKKTDKAPKGMAAFLEPIIVFVRDDIAKGNIGEKKYEKFLPFLLTVFFFILFNNLLGLIPIIPGGANVTGNIAVTMVLAAFTLIITNINGNSAYWQHIFATPGVPKWLYPILIPVEIIGIFTKPFALMIRLFANITAGHIVVLSLISLIFIFDSIGMAAVSVPFTLFISVLELLVAFLQAYIFTMLTALFIGTAVAEHAHH